MIITDGEIIKNIKIDDRCLIFVRPYKKIEFIPGQFVNIMIEGIARSYSIASLPEEEYLMFFIKKVGRVSSLLYNADIGTRVKIFGPFGEFTADKINDGCTIIAAETGLGVARSIYHYLRKRNIECTIIYLDNKDYSYLFDIPVKYVKEIKEIPESPYYYIVGPSYLLKIRERLKGKVFCHIFGNI